MAKIIYTCPRCGTDLIDTVMRTYPAKYQYWCPSCGWTYTEDHEEIIRLPFGGNIGNGAFGNLSCLRCTTNPANGGDGICSCTLGGPSIA